MLRLAASPAPSPITSPGRTLALGRKSSLFAGSAEHAQNLAIIPSSIATCQLQALNPRDQIRHMLIEIQSHPASRIAGLIPWRWQLPRQLVSSRVPV